MPVVRDTRTIVSGVASVAKAGDAAITGAVTLSAGAGVTLTEVGNDISIAAPGSTVQVATKNIANADVLTLPTAAVEIVAAPAGNTILLPLACLLHVTWVADYTNIDVGATLAIKSGTQQSTIGLIEASGGKVSAVLAGGGPDGVAAWMLLDQTQVSGASTALNGVAGLYDADIAGKALNLVVGNGASGNFTGGNVGNTLKVTLWYLTATF